MPDVPTGLGVERDQTVGVETLPDAVAAPEIERRRAGRAEDEAAFLVQREARPDVHAADVGVRVGRPGLVSGLAGPRDGVEAPDQFAGAHVVGADVPGRRRRGPFAQPHAHDEQVAVEDARRRGLQREAAHIPAEVALEVDRSAFAEGGHTPSRPRVEAMEEVVVAVEDPPVRAVGPVDQPAVHAALARPFHGRRIEPPQLTPAGRIEREQLEIRRGAVEHAVDDQRIALDLGPVVGIRATGPIDPRDLQLGDVPRCDLPERGEMAAGLVAEIGAPIGGRRW